MQNIFESDSTETEKYFRRFSNEVFVIKYGGSALDQANLMKHFLSDVARLYQKGVRVVLVHGGGPMLSRKMKEEKISVSFKNGLRVTSKETIRLAAQVFTEVNHQICDCLAQFSLPTQSIVNGTFITARLFDPQNSNNRVGMVDQIDISQFDLEKIPVVSSMGRLFNRQSVELDSEGVICESLLNLNADHLSAALASKLPARKLIYISDVNGIYKDCNEPASKINHITISEIKNLIKEGVLHGGMRYKVETAIEALKSGVKKVHFIDGTIEHSLLYEILTDEGIGTEIVHNGTRE